MNVISDASPLINLARIDQLDLLHRMFGELLIPEAVWKEVVVAGAGQPGAEAVAAATWIKTRAVGNQVLVRALLQDLDAGEAEAIVLASETEAGLLLMDESLGREVARNLGLRYVGLVGVLVACKRRGMIRAIRPHLDALRDIAGFRVDARLYSRVLRDEGELTEPARE